MSRVIGYTYTAAMHCPECAAHAAAVGILTRQPPLRMDTDEHGLAYDLIDREGNPVRPVFSTDELRNESCDGCGEPIGFQGAYTYHINTDERGEFNADVRDPYGATVWETNGEVFEDGYMTHKHDLDSLRDYLRELGIVQDGDTLTKG